MILSKIISTVINKGLLIIKVLGMGSSDVKTVYNILPFGIDSNPSKNYRGVYADTGVNGEKVLIGVILKNVLTKSGELRLFSEDSTGNEVFTIHLKNNGKVEIGGNTDNAVKYSKLDEKIQKLKDDINTELGKISSGIATGGGTYTISPLSIDLSEAKNDNILTN